MDASLVCRAVWSARLTGNDMIVRNKYDINDAQTKLWEIRTAEWTPKQQGALTLNIINKRHKRLIAL